MLKFPCLVLDHDDTVVQSEATINFPFFCYILELFRPGQTITISEYTDGCYRLGFSQMCREFYGFTEQELKDEYRLWQEYIMTHTPAPFAGIERVIHRQKEEGGILCVVSHSSSRNITRDYATHFDVLPDDIYGWDYPEQQRKPSPYPLEAIMKKYNLKPEEILVVDDMKPGYDMSKSAGVPVAFAAWGRRDFPKICREMTGLCDYRFNTPEDLEMFLFDDK